MGRSPQGFSLFESGWLTKCQTDSALDPSAGRWVSGSLPAGRVLSGQLGYVMSHPHTMVVTSYGPTQVSVTDQHPSPTLPYDDMASVMDSGLSLVVIVHYPDSSCFGCFGTSSKDISYATCMYLPIYHLHQVIWPARTTSCLLWKKIGLELTGNWSRQKENRSVWVWLTTASFVFNPLGR